MDANSSFTKKITIFGCKNTKQDGEMFIANPCIY